MFIYFKSRLIWIVILGFASGLPLALTGSTFSTMLTEKGLGLELIGLFGLISAPYSLKVFWSPFIDNLNIPILTKVMGRRRSWLLIIQSLLVISISQLGLIDPTQDVTTLLTFAAITATLSATQDIVIDAFRIDLLNNNEQAAGSAMAIFGYRIAMLVSGAGCLYLATFFDWKTAYFAMAILMLTCMIIILFLREPTTKPIHKQGESFISWFKISFLAPFKDILKRKNWHYILAFIMLYKMGDAFLGMMTSPFLIKTGFTKIEIANIMKVYGLAATLLGTFIAGYLANRYGIYKMIIAGIIGQSLTNLAFIWQYQAGHDLQVLLAVVSLDNFTGGLGSALITAYISILCNKQFSATQYALFSSLATLTRDVFSSSSGYLAINLGWENFFVFTTIVSLSALLIVRKIKPGGQ